MWTLAKRAIGAASGWHRYLMSCDPDGPPPKDHTSDLNPEPRPHNPEPEPEPEP